MIVFVHKDKGYHCLCIVTEKVLDTKQDEIYHPAYRDFVFWKSPIKIILWTKHKAHVALWSTSFQPQEENL